jgi:hypothetical protein
MLLGGGPLVPVVLQLLGTVNDGDRAVRAVHQALAHGTEEESREPTAAASAHDHEAGVLTLAYERLDREPADAVSADSDLGILFLPPGERLGDQGLFLLRKLLPVDGPDGGGCRALDVSQPPCVDNGEGDAA